MKIAILTPLLGIFFLSCDKQQEKSVDSKPKEEKLIRIDSFLNEGKFEVGHENYEFTDFIAFIKKRDVDEVLLVRPKAYREEDEVAWNLLNEYAESNKLSLKTAYERGYIPYEEGP